MKKILFLAVAAMMATMSVNGQDAYVDLKHEVSVSTGAGSTSMAIDMFRMASDLAEMGIQGDMMYDTRKVHGPYSVEYFYRVRPWFAVGVMFIYGKGNIKASYMTGTIPYEGEPIGELKCKYLSLMPAVKFDWIRRQYFGMYTKVALGFTSHSETAHYYYNMPRDVERMNVHPNGQLTLVGMDFGSPHFRGFGELGFGEQGMLLIGLRYKF